MNLHDYFYDADVRLVHIEFSSKKDDDDTIRVLDLSYFDVEHYSSEIIDEDTLLFMTDSFVLDILDNYIRDRGLPSETYL